MSLEALPRFVFCNDKAVWFLLLMNRSLLRRHTFLQPDGFRLLPPPPPPPPPSLLFVCFALFLFVCLMMERWLITNRMQPDGEIRNVDHSVARFEPALVRCNVCASLQEVSKFWSRRPRKKVISCQPKNAFPWVCCYHRRSYFCFCKSNGFLTRLLSFFRKKCSFCSSPRSITFTLRETQRQKFPFWIVIQSEGQILASERWIITAAAQRSIKLTRIMPIMKYVHFGGFAVS